MDTKAKIAVMQAFLDGKQIECQPKNTQRPEWAWIELKTDREPLWDWSSSDYRVKNVVHDLWVNVYKGSDGLPKLGYGFKCEEDAREWHRRAGAVATFTGERMAFIKITFTEGEGL